MHAHRHRHRHTDRHTDRHTQLSRGARHRTPILLPRARRFLRRLAPCIPCVLCRRGQVCGRLVLPGCGRRLHRRVALPCVFMCLCVRECACVRACEYACERVCVDVFMCFCMCMHANTSSTHACLHDTYIHTSCTHTKTNTGTDRGRREGVGAVSFPALGKSSTALPTSGWMFFSLAGAIPWRESCWSLCAPPSTS